MSKRNNTAVLEQDKTTIAEERYRAAVIAAADSAETVEPDSELIDATGRFSKEFAIDVALLQKRRAAVEQLSDAKAMEVEASMLKRPLSDPREMELGQFTTVAEVVCAWEEFTAHFDPACMTPRKLKASELAMDARTIHGEALRLLHSTADPSIADEIDELQRSIQGRRNQIATRQQLANIEQYIAKKRQQIDALLSGDRTDFMGDADRFTPLADIIARSKHELRDLVAMRPAAERAVEDNAKDESAIAIAAERISHLEAQKIVPERMNWSH